uniref:P2Y purinoceptor 14-like n=1 Tax=Cyprinodon variegatus TaxID=28743 RepID=A0A3Q2CVV8_CYPVA
HLTIADLLLCFSLPVRIMHHASSSFTISLLSCSVGTSVLYLNMFASILFMGFIAANYMKIFHSLETNFLMTTKASHIISVTVWFVLLAIATSYTILMLMTYEATQYHRTCEHFMNKRVKTLYLAIHTFAAISFLSVLFSLIFFYCKTFHRLRKIQQRQLGSSSTKLVKSCRNMSVLVIVFCFCFVPYHVVRFLYVLLQGHCSQVFYYIKETAVLISVCNICLDPVIYVFLCKDFRTKFNL